MTVLCESQVAVVDVIPSQTSNSDLAPKFRGELDVVVVVVATKVKRVWKKVEKSESIAFQPGVNRNIRHFDINKAGVSDRVQNDLMFMSLHKMFVSLHNCFGNIRLER